MCRQIYRRPLGQFFLNLDRKGEIDEAFFDAVSSRFAFAGECRVVASPEDRTTEKAVAALEEEWLQATKTNNLDRLAPLLADKIVITSGDGKVRNKAEWLAEMKGNKVVSAENTDLRVTVFGDTAIATGGFKSKATDESGKPFALDIRWTDTWMKMPNGEWQCIASHSSPTKI
jgi:ketosteroid isomerase-like protein